MEILSPVEQLQRIAYNRPMTAMSSQDKKTLGSTCPVIIKHEFPNEQKHYIDNVGQEMSSTKKRFIYDRPNTAKIQQNSIAQQKSSLGMQRSQSGIGLNLPNSFGAMKRNSASAISQSSYQINSTDLYNKLLEGQKIKKESRFVIKPARKLNTFQIHSALFKIKKQKEELDYKIRELEDLKSNFNEMDFYLIANSGAVDYMFNAGQLQNDQETPHYLSQTDIADEDQISENAIASLKNIKNPSFDMLQGESEVQNKKKPLSQRIINYPTKDKKKLNRPQTSIPKQNLTNKGGAVNKVRAATAKADSRDQIEMLRGESRDESRVSADLEILGNCMKKFQDEERVLVEEWGRNIEKPDQVKDNLEQLGSNLSTINRLLSAKSTAPNPTQNPQFGEIKEEEEQEDLQFEPFEQLQNQFYSQNYQQYVSTDPQNFNKNNNNANNFYPNATLPNKNNSEEISQQNRNNQGSIQESQFGQGHQQQQQMDSYPLQEGNRQIQQYGISPTYSTQQQQQQQLHKKNSKRIHSATANHGLFRPSSSSSSIVNSNWLMQQQQQYYQQQNVQARPMTATSGKSFGKTSHHALMSYGPVQVVKERITRNYDHLEILQESKGLERMKKLKEKEKIGHQLDWLSLKVSGAKLQVHKDTYMELQAKSKQVMANMNLIQQVDLNINNHNYLHNNLPHAESHFFSVPSSSKSINVQYKNIPPNRVAFMNQQQLQQQQLQQQQEQQQQLQQQQYNQANKPTYHDQNQNPQLINFQQLHSNPINSVATDPSSIGQNRAAIDLNQMQLDQSVKFMRPSTAKPGSAQQSRLAGQNQNAQFGNKANFFSKNIGMQQNMNVPFAESIPYKLSEADSVKNENNQNNVIGLSNVIFANESVNFNLLHSNQVNLQQLQSGPDSSSNGGAIIQNISMVQSHAVTQLDSQSNQPLSSLQNPPSLQTYQAVGQQQFQFGDIDSQSKNNNTNSQEDEQTIRKKNNRPQTAIKK